MYQKKGCKMTNQEIATKVSQLINYNVNKEGVTCKEFAARKKLNYKLINAYGNGTRIPRLYNYIAIYEMIAGNLARSDAEKIAINTIDNFLDEIAILFSKGYKYADFEQITGIPDAIFYKYKKRLVKDVSLLHAIIIIECFNLNFKIPGLID